MWLILLSVQLLWAVILDHKSNDPYPGEHGEKSMALKRPGTLSLFKEFQSHP